MIKEIYILRGQKSEDYKSFKNKIFELSTALVKQHAPVSLKTCLTLKPPPPVSVIPFKRDKIAVISIERTSGAELELLTRAEGYTGSYMVDEVVPVSYEKTWEDGEQTPGVCLLTLFHKKPGIEQAAFIDRWHNSHTPLSLRLHPLWNYNRNVVTKTIHEDSVWYDGIVEEQFQKSSDLLNPFVFFGPPLKTPRHMYEVLKDTRTFIDMKKIETYLCVEIIFKSHSKP